MKSDRKKELSLRATKWRGNPLTLIDIGGLLRPCGLAMTTILVLSLVQGCKSCARHEKEPEITVTADNLVLAMKDGAPQTEKPDSKIKRIEIGPSGRKEDETVPSVAEAPKEEKPSASTDKSLPPDTFEDGGLTARLREKMADAYAGKEEAIPDVKIYLSEMNYDEFVKYYENLGYKVSRVAVPASEVIAPVLEQRPELAGKIKLADYENVTIHQVMVDEAGISAADKYIDPDTYQIVNKTFVTKMNQ